MKDERKGVSKQEIVKKARENEDLYNFVKSLTKEEINRVKEVREFETIEPHTPTWKIALLCDTIRKNIRKKKSDIHKRMINIQDLTDVINRLKVQLASGLITEEVKTGMKMNEDELKSLIQHHDWTRTGEVNDIPKMLGELRVLVGHKDVLGKVILSQEAFDQLVTDYEMDLKSKGYDLFKELE